MNLPPSHIECTHCIDGTEHPGSHHPMTKLCKFCGGTQKMPNPAYAEAAEDSIDREFVEEYRKLCEKYKRHVNILDYERLGVDRNWDDYYPSLLMPVDRRREREAERERDRQKAIEKEIQHRKVREEYVRNGGTLDEHGNIPVPENYCQLIGVQRVR